MSITNEQMQEIGELALDMAKSYREALRAQFNGMGPGQRGMSAEEHKDWYEMHARGWWEQGPPQTDPTTGQPQVDQMGQPIPSYRFKDGPNWVRALTAKLPDGSALVEGGRAETMRYLETLRKANNG